MSGERIILIAFIMLLALAISISIYVSSPVPLFLLVFFASIILLVVGGERLK